MKQFTETHLNLRISNISAYFATIICLIYCAARRGFENPLIDVINVLGIAYFILFFPDFISRIRKEAAHYNECFLTLITLAIVTGSGFLILDLFHWQYVFVVLGYVFITISLSKSVKNTSIKDFSTFCWITVFAIGASSVTWEGRHLSPLFFEMLSDGEFSTNDFGKGLDTLFHMALTQMIKTYNVPSIGFDQLVTIKYHYGSHFVFAQFSKVLNLHVLKTYQLAYPVIFFAVFLKVFLCSIISLRKRANIENRSFSNFFWIILLLGFFGFIPVSFRDFLLERVGLGLDSIWVSESYLFSLIIFFSLMSIGLSIQRVDLLQFTFEKKNFKTLSNLLLILLLIIISGLFKVSTMVILITVTGYLFLRVGLFKNYRITLFFFGFLVFSFFTMILVNPIGGATDFEFAYSFRKFISASLGVFILFYFFLFFAVILFSFLIGKLYVGQNLIHHVKDRSGLHIEILIVIAVAGFVPGMIIKIEGGSAFYFSEIQYWFSLFIILSMFVTVKPYVYALLNKISIPNFLKKRKAIKRMAFFFISLIILFNVFIRVAIFISANLRTRSQIIAFKSTPQIKDDKYQFVKDLTFDLNRIKEACVVFSAPVNKKLNEIPIYRLLSSIERIDSSAHKEETIIFIKNYATFMNYFPCQKYHFIIPALTGLASLEGYDDESCGWMKNYGFEDYPKSERSFYNASENNLCEEIGDTRFRKIVVYDLTSATQKVIQCED